MRDALFDKSLLFNQFKDAKVLITGHTGFKGSWLTKWVNAMGSKVIGISLDIPSKPSHFESLDLKDNLKDIRLDINDLVSLKSIFAKEQPDFIFHMAAQPIVKESFKNPIRTWETNTFGTINILESLRELDKSAVAIFITSDKCYDNLEWPWGYRENDKLGGPDPYSASKGAAEIAISSYVRTYFPPNGNIKVGIGRAGNVIGGGDWATYRIVPDCIRAWARNDAVQLRSPNATRPWQHVLEPLSGYLALASSLYENNDLHGEAFNFGPSHLNDFSVFDLVKKMSEFWEKVKWEDISKDYLGPKESSLLKLNCDKASSFLKWSPVWNFPETIESTVNWYKDYYENPDSSVSQLTQNQINLYIKKASKMGMLWTK